MQHNFLALIHAERPHPMTSPISKVRLFFVEVEEKIVYSFLEFVKERVPVGVVVY